MTSGGATVAAGRRSDRLGIALALGSALAFATMGSIAKTAYDHGVGVSGLLSVRFAVGALVWGALGWRRLLGLRWSDRPVLWALAAGVVGGGVAGFAEFEAYRHLPVAMVVVLLFTNPVWLAIAQRFFLGTRLGLPRVGAIASVILGVVLLVNPAGAPASIPGVLLALGASLAVTVLFVGLHRAVRALGVITSLALVALSATVVNLIPALMADTLAPVLAAPEPLALAVGLGLVSSVLGWTLLSASIFRIGPLDAAVIAATEPLMAGLIAWVALGETLAPVQILGALLVVLATAIIDRARVAEALRLRVRAPRR